MTPTQKDIFTGRMFRRQYIPALVSAFGLAFADMADALVIGQRMGVTGLAAISLALPVFMVYNTLMHGMGAGGSIRYATQLARGEREQARAGFQGVMLVTILAGALLAVLGNVFLKPLLAALGTTPDDGALFGVCRDYVRIILWGTPVFFASYVVGYYLRSDDQAKLASVGFTAGNITDLVLNVVLVLWMNKGAAGAAWSTVAGQVVTLAIYCTGLFGRSGTLRLIPGRPVVRGAAACLRNGLSTSTQYIFNMIFLLVANHMLLRTSGSVGVAVFDVVQNASFLVMYLYGASGQAVQPLLSTYVGEHNEDGSRNAMRLSLGWGAVAGVAAVLFIAVCPELVCRAFGVESADAVELGRYALRVYCLGGVFAGMSTILESCCQACGQEKKAFLLATLRGAVFLLPMTVLFSLLGARAFWWLYPATEIGAIAVFLARRPLEGMDTLAPERIFRRTIHSSNEEVASLVADIEGFCETWEAAPRQTYFVTMAAEELCTAIQLKGFQNQPDGFMQITLIAEENGDFSLLMRDNAVSFDPFSMKTKKMGSGEDVDMDAMGVLVLREKAKDFFYRRYQGFNSLIIKI